MSLLTVCLVTYQTCCLLPEFFLIVANLFQLKSRFFYLESWSLVCVRGAMNLHCQENCTVILITTWLFSVSRKEVALSVCDYSLTNEPTKLNIRLSSDDGARTINQLTNAETKRVLEAFLWHVNWDDRNRATLQPTGQQRYQIASFFPHFRTRNVLPVLSVLPRSRVLPSLGCITPSTEAWCRHWWYHS